MKRYLNLTICFIAATLIFGSLAEFIHFDRLESCACCKSKCPNENKCHKNTNACLCSSKVPLQVTLIRNGVLPKPVFSGYATQRLHFVYSFSPAKEIFHPPRTL